MPIGTDFSSSVPSFVGTPAPVTPNDDLAMGQIDGQNQVTIARALAKRNALQRLSDFLGSDEGRAALLRSGAATMQGGLGAGIAAGANYVEGEKDRREKEAQLATENALKGRGLDIQGQHEANTNSYQQGTLGLGLGDLEERGRADRANEALAGRGQNITMRGQDVGARVQSRGQDVERAGQLTAAGTQLGIANLDTSTQRDIAGERNQLERDAWSQDPVHVAAGIGSKIAGTRVTTKVTPARTHWFGPNDPATTERTTEVLPTPGPVARALGGGASSLSRPPGLSAPQGEPMPASPDQAVPGKVYQTVRGPARWDGTQFIPLN